MKLEATYVTKGNVLYEGGVEVAALDDLFEGLEEDAIEMGVLETTLAGLGQGCADGEGDNDIVGVLRQTAQVRVSLEMEFEWRFAAKCTYILSIGFWPGVRWESTEDSLWAAIV